MKKQNNSLVITLLVVMIAMIIFSCTAKSPLAPSMEQDRKVPDSEDQMVQADKPEITEVETLLELAMDLEQGASAVEVLRLYGKALKIADQGEEVRVRAYLNRFLATVDDAELERLSASEFIEIPRAEIMYRLGLNYGAQGKSQSAIEILVQFLKEYPDHLNAQNARKVLLLVQEHLFRKNTVGCLLPMSGNFSIFGERALKGIEIAVQDLSAQYDQKITVMIKDTQSDDARAVTLVQELAAQKVAGIAGAIITSEAAAKEAQHWGIPLIALTQKSQVAKIGDYVFSNFLTPEIQTQALASYAVRILSVEKFAILYPDDKYGITHMNFFRDRVSELGGEVVGAESYGKDQTDFSNAIKKLAGKLSRRSVEIRDLNQNSSFDSTAFFIPDSPSKVGMILPQLAYHDVTGSYLLGTNLWHDESLIRGAEKYAKKAVITDGFFARGSNQRARDFAERFEALFGQTPGFIEAVAYDTLMILVQTAMESGVNSRADLKKALAGQRIFEGVTGRTMFDPDGNAQKELVFITIRQGAFHEIDR
ncbi:MAG: ABC transporter substrate-binding protein [Desulfobacterium sp.]|nr:ABC transporter substrate-binding protein [Desulfobacterium sp.]